MAPQTAGVRADSLTGGASEHSAGGRSMGASCGPLSFLAVVANLAASNSLGVAQIKRVPINQSCPFYRVVPSPLSPVHLKHSFVALVDLFQ
jgi:hypothetical protein